MNKSHHHLAKVSALCLSFFANFFVGSEAAAADMSIPLGWSLVGYSGGISSKVDLIFGSANNNNIPNVTSNIVTVWKWSGTGWYFWTPSLTPSELAIYAANKGYQVLTDLFPGDGYWINANAPVVLNDFGVNTGKVGTFDTLRKVDNLCHGYTFNPNKSTLAVALVGTQLTLTEDDFFDGRCIYTAPSISSPLTGTFRCANSAFDVGTFTLTGDRQNDVNELRLAMDVVTTSRACNYKIKFVGYRQ